MPDCFLSKFRCIINKESLHWYYIVSILPWSVLIEYDLVFIILVFIILPVYGRNIADKA